MIGLETARKLLDFRGPTGALSAAAAEEQLRGAVALHNILKRKQVAYLADEVGMGKTYVALGVVALFRHFDPRSRLLVIAPRGNIQRKWVKELRNFVRNNVLVTDLRVKAVHGAPARAPVACSNLAELVRETALNPDRDFFARLSSFSLPLGTDAEGWKRRRKELLDHLPWADPEGFDLHSRERFKDAYGRALCSALPVFDLVIVDEGHNLKHGFGQHVSARNRVLGLAFGHPSESGKGFPGYGPRARRVLFLSATPLENDYGQLWNQLDVFGKGDRAPDLDPRTAKDVTDQQKRDCAQQFLIRRMTSIPVAGFEQGLTKNLYRREWRAGGVADHDQPLEITGPDRDRQRLVVALVQKKVSEVLSDAKFNNSFQIGMLASFESFLQTAKVLKPSDGDDPATFDDADQTDDPDERMGADLGQVNRLALSYRRNFDGAELPHPKMDALVDRLAADLPAGRKALVFVRRVASVKELQAKLEERYDEWLFERLRTELPDLRPGMERAFALYREERSKRRTLTSAPGPPPTEGTDGLGLPPGAPEDAEAGGLDSFFAWFFRGKGPDGFLSGAALKKRFADAGAAYSTFFEENTAAWLLDARPGEVLDRLAGYLTRDRQGIVDELRRRATPLLPGGTADRGAKRHLFVAMQAAAVQLLSEAEGALREQARIVLHELQLAVGRPGGGSKPPDGIEKWLEEPTFFTELRARPDLRTALWPVPKATLDTRQALREQELRRLVLSGQARLGHAFIDLYVLALQRIRDLRPRARDEHSGSEGLIAGYLDILDAQRTKGQGDFLGFRELSLTAEHFDLILDVNRPELRTAPLGDAAREVGTLLGSQQPIGGMFGSINDTLVRQFRLPGYPFVLFTTDLLQEGEDLHTFCSAVHHYGISWMPSSMEQRVGRIDRVNSQTQRRLTSLAMPPEGQAKLQVFYPHLRETVEVLQVRRVLSRMNQFIRMMHRDLRQPDQGEQRVYLNQAMLEPWVDIQPVAERLESAFPVANEMLAAADRPLAVPAEAAHEVLARFHRLKALQPAGLSLVWEDQHPADMLLGTAWLQAGRKQPYSLILRSLDGRLMVRCVSPVGRLDGSYDKPLVRERTRARPIQVGAVWDDRFKTYNLNVEAEVLLGPHEADANRVASLVHRVVSAADDLELEMLQRDEPLATFRDDITQESPDVGN